MCATGSRCCILLYLWRIVELARRDKNLPKGEIPSAIDPPAGCHFHPRCLFAMPKCREG
ncbi:MAG: hypothetical protein IMZ69_01300, partial [Spirochaetes bacterium]|nr:hypothetical protein [Spirochaetota bacterium]